MNNSKISIRNANPGDLTEMQELFVNTISTICKNDYSVDQIHAWTSSIENIPRWNNRIASQYFLVADLDNKIVGYASLKNNDYLDLLYVHKDYQKRGIASKLYSEIEKQAIRNNSTTLYADVSKTAKPFFLNRGFKIIQMQAKKIKGIEIINYKMIKHFDYNEI